MKKIITLFVFFIVSVIVVNGQTFNVSGFLGDEETLEPIIGAHVILESEQDRLASISDISGRYLFEQVPSGTYTIEFSYVGYETVKTRVNVVDQDVILGDLKMQIGIDLEEIEIVERVLPVLQKGDTTEFQATAYKTLPDASAEDLISKMPTIVVDNGKVQAQGEDVQKVLVDGKEFFGSDPTAALRNLPAEIIDRIQVFDEQSDQAQFTGFDDGEYSKTINIITKPDMRSGQFGKIYGGYGLDNRYTLGGNINFFNGDQRISVIGLSNNINQQNFSSADLLGVVSSTGGRRGGRGGGGGGGRGNGGGGSDRGGSSSSEFLVPSQGGISETNAVGINFTDEWGEKLEVTASYFFNKSDNTTDQLLEQIYFDAEGLDETYFEDGIYNSTNTNHRISGKIDYEINENNTLTWRPRATWQSNNGLESVFGQTTLGTTFLNQTSSEYVADLKALNFSNNLTWRHKFAREGRTFSVSFNGGLAPKTGNSNLLSENIFGIDTSALNQLSLLDQGNWNISGNLVYTEPLSENSRLMVNYRASYQREDSEKETFDFLDETMTYDVFNEDLSNVFSNDYFSQNVGAGYNYNLGDWRMMLRGGVQWAQLLTDQTLPYTASTDNQFFNFLPMAMLSYRSGRTQNFSLRYFTRTDLPSISQLQNVLDNSNPVQLSIGNPDLIQAYQHDVSLRYTNTNTEKSSVFFVMLRASLEQDNIANSIYSSAFDYNSELEPNAQITVPVNLDGAQSFNTFLTYGFPIELIKSNLNIDLTGSYTKSPGLINEQLNFTKNKSGGVGLTLSSNISDRVDFTVSTRSSYNVATNSIQTQSNTTYFNQRSMVKLDWIIADGLVFRTDLSHQFYDGLAASYDQNVMIWNMSIGKKLFENDRGEISLGVYDILKQNTSLTRNVTELYTEDIQTNVLQQYFMLSFKYDLRHFGTAPTTNNRERPRREF